MIRRDVLKKYKKFIFRPCHDLIAPEAPDRGIDPDDLERLVQWFHNAVTDELKKSGRYEIVDAPGPDVLELDVAITNVEHTGGKKNAAVSGGAAAGSVATVPGIGLAVPRLSVGRLSIEGEMLDFASGERQVAFVTGNEAGSGSAALQDSRDGAILKPHFRTFTVLSTDNQVNWS